MAQRRKDYDRLYKKARREAHLEIVIQEKLRRQHCLDCWYKVTRHNHFCFDFDHRDPLSKRLNIAKMILFNLDVIIEEMGKCDLVCSNCHRLRTREQRKDGKLRGQRRRHNHPTLFDDN